MRQDFYRLFTTTGTHRTPPACRQVQALTPAACSSFPVDAPSSPSAHSTHTTLLVPGSTALGDYRPPPQGSSCELPEVPCRLLLEASITPSRTFSRRSVGGEGHAEALRRPQTSTSKTIPRSSHAEFHSGPQARQISHVKPNCPRNPLELHSVCPSSSGDRPHREDLRVTLSEGRHIHV